MEGEFIGTYHTYPSGIVESAIIEYNGNALPYYKSKSTAIRVNSNENDDEMIRKNIDTLVKIANAGLERIPKEKQPSDVNSLLYAALSEGLQKFDGFKDNFLRDVKTNKKRISI